ncbi:hypothetical protein CR513_46447, partial [Mucuna pruriens]
MPCALDTKKAKQSMHQHKYTTRLKSKVMENKVEALEQQNQDLRGEVGQLQEQMVQMFQILTQTNVTVKALVNTNDVGYTQNGYARNAKDPPYGMSSGAGLNPKKDSRTQHQTSGNPPPFVVLKQASHIEEKWQSLEKRLHAIEGGDKYELEAVNLFLVANVGLPANFNTLEFDKYKGSSCLSVHLAMYCRKMAAYIYDDKVLIHYFQDSLIGAALSWYVALERGRVKTWRDLTEAFLKQYKYNEDMAPDRSWL